VQAAPEDSQAGGAHRRPQGQGAEDRDAVQLGLQPPGGCVMPLGRGVAVCFKCSPAELALQRRRSEAGVFSRDVSMARLMMVARECGDGGSGGSGGLRARRGLNVLR
jgi:hypothetical protein